jgi:lipase maturation factor 1
MADANVGYRGRPDPPMGRPDRPTMLYDGQCAFCRRWIARWRHLTGETIDYQASQEAGARFGQIEAENFGRAVYLVEPSGAVSRGAGAIFRALQLSGRYRALAGAYEWAPGFAWVSELAYSTVARHRDAADRLDRLLIGPQSEPASYRITQQVFLRLLGVIFIIAFTSLWVQIDGLIGSQGILPIHSYLDSARSILGTDRFRLLPTLCWISGSDGFLHLLCGAGVAAGMLVVCGVLQLPALVVLWACYLSLTIAGREFLSFQWDILLLEGGFLAIFFAPWRLVVWPWRGWTRFAAAEPSRVMLWMLRWLLFRVMFMSGVLKLSSGDATWRGLTAMQFHYETQPLPTWTSWYFFQLPVWFQKFSCGVVFFAELVIPVLIFGPRRVRLLAFWGIVLFQMLIAGTGNYGFFNFLTIVLCCTLPDDTFWRWILRRRTLPAILNVRRISPWRWPGWVTAPLGAVLLSATLPQFVEAFDIEVRWPRPLIGFCEWVAPLRIANGYGLFRVMTTRRYEINIEGSDDGRNWKEYSFKWKPGDLRRAPAFVSPHMPRLDWQMWFAALGTPAGNQWIVSLLDRLLEGSPPVLGLLETNPFPDHPPRYVRAVLYEYHFTDRATRQSTGAWWRSEPLGIYCQLSPNYAPGFLENGLP